MAFDTKKGINTREWQCELRKTLWELLSPWPSRVPLEPSIVHDADCRFYRRYRVTYRTTRYLEACAYLLIPKAASDANPMPAILCLHGHAMNPIERRGKENVVGVTDTSKPKQQEAIRLMNYDYAHQLANQGFVTLAADTLGWGDRAAGYEFSGRDPCNIHYLKAQLWGLNLMSIHLHEDMCALDFLQGLPEVNSDQLGTIGLSMGGTRALFLAALDERVKAVDVSCFLTTFSHYAIRASDICGAQLVPGILRYAELSDVAALIAPRAALYESGTGDHIFPVEVAQEVYQSVKRVYEEYGEAELVEHEIFKGGHRFAGGRAFSFFEERLKSG